jgi:hypothetical protein
MVKFIDYNKVVDQAMRSIVRRCLRFVLKNGNRLPGNHHFYITFDLDHTGTEISDKLRKTHVDQMTIVMQHQFWDLVVEEDFFSVALSFNNVREKLVVPYDALISFADPSSRFGLQFHNEDDQLMLPDDDEEIDDELLESLLQIEEEFEEEEKLKKSTRKKGRPGADGIDSGEGSKVISIDSFRKK